MLIASAAAGCYASDRCPRTDVMSQGPSTRPKREEVVMIRSLRRRLAYQGLSVLSVIIVAGAAAAELKVGDPAPSFSLKGSDGKNYSLDQFKGKSAVVIAWFPKA